MSLLQSLEDALDYIAALDLVDELDALIGGQFHFHRTEIKRGGLPRAKAIAQTLTLQNGRVLYFKRGQGVSGIQVERLLKRYHMPIWGRWFSKTELMFTVPKWQARWAEYIMRRAGVPVLSVVDPQNVDWAAQHAQAPKPWESR